MAPPRSIRAGAGIALGVLVLLVACAPSSPEPASGVVLVPRDATWRASTRRPQFPDDWAAPGFRDEGWVQGQGPLGIAQHGVATRLPTPAGASPPHRTVYLRTVFELPHSAEVQDEVRGLTVHYQLDDGLRLLLNGEEVLRHNLPAGPIGPETPAPRAVSGAEERRWHRLVLPVEGLRKGRNWLAAEVHQHDAGSRDLWLALELRGHRAGDPAHLVRGPYLQQTTARRTLLRFQTDRPLRPRVWLGPAPDRLELAMGPGPEASDHRLELALPATGPVYYAIDDGRRRLAGGDAAHRIRRPLDGRPVRAWVTGDQGSADSRARAVLAGMRAAAGERPPDLWITLGDNAYPSGSLAELQAAVFATFAPLLAHTTLWPSPGNHDLESADLREDRGPYFEVFDPPTRGEAGGIPSGRKRWYAFDWGPLHVVSLDTVSGTRERDGAMLRWLERDLAWARPRRPWIVAAFHHPPYSRGSHDSAREVTTQLVAERVVPLLEAGGADLVLAGHSHDYERSRLGPGPVYVVAGHASIPDGGPLDHPRMAVGLGGVLGSLLIDADDCRLGVRAIDERGRVVDSFARQRPAPCAP